MGKSVGFKWKKSGNISKEMISMAVEAMFKNRSPKPPIAPPEDLREFEDRLNEFLDHLYDWTFGNVYYLSPNKRLRKDTSIENLINVGIQCKKILRQEEIVVIYDDRNCYKFLKSALEKNYPFSQRTQKWLGIKIDSSGLTLHQQDVIAVQSTAHILWYLKGNEIPSIEKMEEWLLDRKHPFFELLNLGRFKFDPEDPESRAIKDWVREVFPIPPLLRKKKRHDKNSFNNLISIPGVFSANGTNFQKLIFSIMCITRILRVLNWKLDEIFKSKFIHQLAEPLKFYPRSYVNSWVEEAFLMNGSIFPPDSSPFNDYYL